MAAFADGRSRPDLLSFKAYLTTIVTALCLDRLNSRPREHPLAIIPSVTWLPYRLSLPSQLPLS